MESERGILVNGEVLPGTERVLRRPDAWWARGDIGWLSRAGHTIDQITTHWTGSTTSTGPDAARIAVRNTKARKGKTGQPLKVGVHFYVFGDSIWQTADLADGFFHVGHRPTVRRSVGIEADYPGTHAQALKLGVPHEVFRGFAKGGPVKAMVPPAEVTEGLVWLVSALCSAQHPAMRIPRKRGGLGKPGIIEHCDCPGEKLDTAGAFLGALGLTRSAQGPASR